MLSVECLRRFVFICVVMVFAAIGGAFLYVHAATYLVMGASNSKDTRLEVQRMKAMAVEVDRHVLEHGALPTAEQLNCDWEPCERHERYVWTWSIEAKPEGGYILSLHSLGVPFMPLGSVAGDKVHLDSSDHSTDRDHLVHPWQWHVRFIPYAAAGILIVLLPWAGRILRRIERHRVSTSE